MEWGVQENRIALHKSRTEPKFCYKVAFGGDRRINRRRCSGVATSPQAPQISLLSHSIVSLMRQEFTLTVLNAD
ncbi:hypothetical protein evm_005057 [Chilo suppressalis]|nr:hypothetical protein evm_005057 [Chilo suppressalis]